ncbi:MAG: chemotaxis protein CheW [Oscillospiraceae bacterium]
MEEKNSMEPIEQGEEMPWLVFRLKGQHFAVNSSCVMSIFMLQQDIVAVPGYSSNVRGVINLRGDMIPVLELRLLMGMETMESEHEAFDWMMEQRKQDHINWVTELVRCKDCGESFSLATDPHKCAFGKWYDAYRPTEQSVVFQLGKIAEPHERLHTAAKRMMALQESADERQAEIQALLQETQGELMPRVLQLLEETKAVVRNSAHEMCVVLAQNGGSIGILTDEVSAMEQLEFMGTGKEFSGEYNSSMVRRVARSAAIQGTILVLDTDAVFAAV